MGKLSMPIKCLMAVCLWAAFAEAEEYMKYRDPKQPLNMRIKDLMRRMTLEENIGQMTQIERVQASPTIIKKYFIGSVISGAGSGPAPKASAEYWVKMVNEYQKGALSTRLGIPIIDGIDAIHGHSNVHKATVFPHNTWCHQVCRDPRWGHCYESFSEDHNIVRAMTEMIPGLQGDIPFHARKGVPFVANVNTKVVACAKHFVGDCGTVKGIDANDTIIDFHGLLSIHMPPFLDSIIKGVATVMVAYSSLTGKKMHANRDMDIGFLKNKLKFKGFVESDWKGIDSITNPPQLFLFS
ncbi:Glucan 1,3-beta-glucosidase [Handroanthus impetiginosus]|uniref:beta-glucosidase n=1 Tax=Handroanthus impetiginosus TaxID=429701 RepID=A0A2G9GCE7_9LAMI|nr:Glucan 1,3-beta-glucosidase [Handroanthus impetiginosus]